MTPAARAALYCWLAVMACALLYAAARAFLAPQVALVPEDAGTPRVRCWVECSEVPSE